MPAPDRAPKAYNSAFDLPSFVEMRQQLAGLKAMSIFKWSLRPDIKAMETQLNYIGTTVDEFYRVLGERYWVFHDSLSLPDIAGFCAEPHVEDAERQFIEMYRDEEALRMMLNRIRRHAELAERWELLELAYNDYRCDRYHGTIHLLISVMDGFVQNFETERRGLHTRAPEEMNAWDSVVSHHMGLARVHREVFTKSFKKTTSEETTELYRHGIVHGNLTNYANVVVATKAWNYLFAVADWAVARERAAAPEKPTPTLKEMLQQIARTGEQKKAVDDWQSRTLTSEDEGFSAQPMYRACEQYLSLWSSRNYGGMSELIASVFGGTDRRGLPKRVNEEYRGLALTDFAITELNYEAPAICQVSARLVVNDNAHAVVMRWLYEDEAGEPRVEPQAGSWRLVLWGPVNFLER